MEKYLKPDKNFSQNEEKYANLSVETKTEQDTPKKTKKSNKVQEKPKESKSKPNRQIPTNIAKSRELIFIFDCRDGNPNGERETGISGPRIDPLTGKSIVTDICLKRMIRDYFKNTTNSDIDKIIGPAKLTFTANDVIQLKNVFTNDFEHEESELRNWTQEEIQNEIAYHFIDHRLFGSMNIIRKDMCAITGAVQFENALSMNKPNLIECMISSTMSSEAGKGAGSLGKTKILDYSILIFHGIIKNSLAKLSWASEDDVCKMYDALWDGTKSEISRTKPQRLPRLLLGFVMKDRRQQIPYLKNSIKLINENVNRYKDCIFVVNDFIQIISNYSQKIESIEYKVDPEIHFKHNENNFEDIVELFKMIPNCPTLKKM